MKINIKKVIFVIGIPIILLSVSVGYLLLDFNSNPKRNTNTSTIDGASSKDEKNRVSFLAVGDNIGHERVYTYADANAGTVGDGKYDFQPSYSKMKERIKKADLAFINQESIIGGDSLGISGYPAFNSPEQLASDLIDTGFDVINGASNHSLDKGFAGIKNAAAIWRSFENIIYVGTYDSQEDADTIRVIERNGITFSLLSYTYGTNGYTLPNTYCVPLFDRDKITNDVAKAKEISDVVIVSAHWGDEGESKLSEMQVSYAQLFADVGVDLVIGTHPHVIQPLEWVNGVNGNKTLVAYSLGNFLSTMETVDTQLEGMLSLDFVKKEGVVTIENIIWTPLVNHFGDGTFCVMPLKEYTDKLNATHYVLADQKPNAISYFTEKTKEIIGDDFKIEL